MHLFVFEVKLNFETSVDFCLKLPIFSGYESVLTSEKSQKFGQPLMILQCVKHFMFSGFRSTTRGDVNQEISCSFRSSLRHVYVQKISVSDPQKISASRISTSLCGIHGGY